MSAADDLLQGVEILNGKLRPLGFAFELAAQGRGSGGDFAEGYFVNGDRSIFLWFRRELGAVSYRKGEVECRHQSFMQALGRERDAQFPGYDHSDPLNSFRRLLHDLDYGDAFLLAEGESFRDLMATYKYLEKKGFPAD